MARIDPKITKAKEEYVTKLAKEDPETTMFTIARKVEKKFGTQLAFDKLKEAFLAGGGILRPRGRRRKDGEGGLSAVKSAGFRSKIGRRDSDISAAVVRQTLGRMPNHMVVMFQDGELFAKDFKTLADAKAYISEMVAGGMSLADIGYYERNKVEIQLDI